MAHLIPLNSFRCFSLQASLIAERSFREVGAVLVQLEESQVARQALEAERQRLAQQVETIKGEVAEKINLARREAEEEAERKYLAKYREYRANAESEFKRLSDDLRAKNSKLQEELSKAKEEMDAQDARLQSRMIFSLSGTRNVLLFRISCTRKSSFIRGAEISCPCWSWGSRRRIKRLHPWTSQSKGT